MVTRKAKRAGTCDGCGQPVCKGEWIVWVPTPIESPETPPELYHQDCKPSGDHDADEAYWRTRDGTNRAAISRRIYGRTVGDRWAHVTRPDGGEE